MITVEESKSKICPLSMANPTTSLNCVGTSCMAWECKMVEHTADEVVQTGEQIISYRVKTVTKKVKSQTEGYCRLFSKNE